VQGPEGRNHLEDSGVYGRIILKWGLKKWDVKTWNGLIWLTIGKGEGGNEPSDSTKCGEFLH
jgi:hypothetical protein